jgi:hypothetical protein
MIPCMHACVRALHEVSQIASGCSSQHLMPEEGVIVL